MCLSYLGINFFLFRFCLKSGRYDISMKPNILNAHVLLELLFNPKGHRGSLSCLFFFQEYIFHISDLLTLSPLIILLWTTFVLVLI